MQLYTIDTGFFKLDGGAMFGVVPKVLWSQTNPADENNLCSWAMRSLLIEDGNKLILIDNGIGDKQDDKFLKHYYLHGDVNLHSSLAKHGFCANDGYVGAGLNGCKNCPFMRTNCATTCNWCTPENAVSIITKTTTASSINRGIIATHKYVVYLCLLIYVPTLHFWFRYP